MSTLTTEQLGEIASLNSVSRAYATSYDDAGNGSGYSRDFTGNDLAFAHTVEETERKKFTTQPELNDEALIKKAEALEAAEALAAANAAAVTAALAAGWTEVTPESTDGIETVTAFPTTVSTTTTVKFNGKYYQKTVS